MTETTKICRTINVDIEESSRYRGRTGNKVSTKDLPGKKVPLADFLATILPGKPIESVGRSQILELGYARRPTSLFFQAVHECFDEHYALTLRPEVLMHLIVSEVATTVRRNPEDYRSLFTSSKDKEKSRIDVEHNGLRLGDPSSPWHEVLSMFGSALRERVPPGIMEHMLPPFSTATVESQAASMVAFMDAAGSYYDYHCHTLCGIPEVRLAGEPEDYRRILNAARQLAEPFGPHLGRYFDHLLPVLSTLSEQAAGAPVDQSFWRSIYKYESHSGSNLFNGWITAFVNYVQTVEIQESKYQKAQKGEVVAKPEELYDWTQLEGPYGMRGLNVGSVPAQVCTAPFTWHCRGEEKKMLFAGGVLGVDDVDGSVTPSLSYAVLRDE